MDKTHCAHTPLPDHVRVDWDTRAGVHWPPLRLLPYPPLLLYNHWNEGSTNQSFWFSQNLHIFLYITVALTPEHFCSRPFWVLYRNQYVVISFGSTFTNWHLFQHTATLLFSLSGHTFAPLKHVLTDGFVPAFKPVCERPVWSLEHLVLIGQNGGVYLITTAATVWHPQPNDGYQLCKQPPHPRSIFIVFEQQCYISWPPLSTTHTGHSKQKIHTIDPPMSPQLLFPNSHWGQITSALPFHPVTMAEQ